MTFVLIGSGYQLTRIIASISPSLCIRVSLILEIDRHMGCVNSNTADYYKIICFGTERQSAGALVFALKFYGNMITLVGRELEKRPS